MKTKKYIIILACCILAAAFILGMTGVVNLSTGIQVKNSDRLIGFLITRTSLDQDDNQLTQADDYHYPATRVETQGTIEVDGQEEPYTSVDYVFEGIEGFPFMLADTTNEDGVNSSTTISDGTVSDVQVSHSQTDDNVTEESLSGTLYLARGKDDYLFWFNPIYQTADGDVYAVSAASGMAPSLGLCSSVSTHKTQDLSWTEGLKTFTRSMRVEVKMLLTDKPVKVSIYQYNADHGLIHPDEYDPRSVPETISPRPLAEYIVIETETDGGDPIREIYGKKDESFTVKLAREDGICVAEGHEIIWPKWD